MAPPALTRPPLPLTRRPSPVGSAARRGAQRGHGQAARQQQVAAAQGEAARQPRLGLLHCALLVGGDGQGRPVLHGAGGAAGGERGQGRRGAHR
eukprot:3102978-Prymnesium_polylepis.1